MYVGITNGLLSQVRQEIDAMQNKELASLGDFPTPTITESDVEAQLWGEHLHLKSSIPQEWMSQISELQVRMPFMDSSGNTRRFDFYVSFPNNIAAPPNTSRYGLKITLSDAPDPRFDAARAWAANQLDTNTRWAKVKGDIKSFLENCKSLNEALKLYPDIAIYIPKHFIEKVEEKRESAKTQSKAAEILAGIDTDSLRAAAVISRLS